MSRTLYWAVKLNNESIAKLLSSCPPIHPNVYAEHLTLAFKPTDEEEDYWAKRHGDAVTLHVNKFAFDNRGQAVMASGIERSRGGITHITISCANGVSPVYSNELLASQELQDLAQHIGIDGTILRKTRSGWE